MAVAIAPSSPILTAGDLLTKPHIAANRRRLDDRFPSLGFLIDTGGRPFFEVLLATEPSLLDPAAATRRSGSTFFSSRTASGLLPSAQADHPYLVPSAVLRTFASSTPRPSAIFYTVVSYADATGAGATFGVDPARLASTAPSVALAPDFSARTLATVLGVSVDKLRHYSGATLADTSRSGPAPSALPTASDDALEGEDGFGLVPPVVASEAPQPDGGAAAAGLAAEGDYELSLLPAVPAMTSTRNRSRVVDPVLPGQAIVPNRPIGFAQGEDFPIDGEEPEYLQADDDNDDSFLPDTRDAAADLEPHHGRYLSLEDESAITTASRPISIEDKMRIIDRIAPFESGGDYGAINADGEFEGRFGTSHPAFQRYHVGLSYGLIQFTQDSGKLGELLAAMKGRDAQAFDQVFGPNAAELIAVTTAPGPPSSAAPDGRSVRVQPVAGADLWREPWLARFRGAAQVEAFRAAQREAAARGYLDPMLRFASRLGLDDERAITVVVDRAVQMGPGGAKRWIIGAVGPVVSDAMRSQALAALGYADLRSFQAASPGLQVDGEFGPETHAELVAALRRLGPASPVPLPTADQMLETMIRQAASEPWHERVEVLGRAPTSGTHFQL